MKVAVLGAAGTIAPAIVRDLAASDEVGELLLLDLDGSRAQQVASLHGGSKALAARTDALAPASDPGSLTRTLEGCDVLVNLASHRVNLDAMAACLHAGCRFEVTTPEEVRV
jgi:saccharopine dehydrogenase-like NADP-dependent oxidoreductase